MGETEEAGAGTSGAEDVRAERLPWVWKAAGSVLLSLLYGYVGVRCLRRVILLWQYSTNFVILSAETCDVVLCGSILVLLPDFAEKAMKQLGFSGLNPRSGVPWAAVRFRVLICVKVALELLAFDALAHESMPVHWGGAFVIGSHLLINTLNNQMVSSNGELLTFPLASRAPLIIADAVLCTCCLIGLGGGVMSFLSSASMLCLTGVYWSAKLSGKLRASEDATAAPA